MKAILRHINKLLLLLVIFPSQIIFAQVINDGIFGQNANLTDKVGVKDNAGGKLDRFWGFQLWLPQSF